MTVELQPLSTQMGYMLVVSLNDRAQESSELSRMQWCSEFATALRARDECWCRAGV